MSERFSSERRMSAGGRNLTERDLPAPSGRAKRLLAEEGLENEGPLLGALEALEQLGRTAPPVPSGDLAKLLSGTRPDAAVVPLARGRKRRAAAGGTIAALVLVAGLGGAAAASPALRGQVERAIAAVVPVVVSPGGVEVDRAQLESVPSPTPAAPPSAEPGDGTAAEAPGLTDDAGADASGAAGNRSAQDGGDVSEDRQAKGPNGASGNGQGNRNGQDSGSNQSNGTRDRGQGNGAGQENRAGNGNSNGNGHGSGAWDGSWRGSGAWDGSWNGKGRGNGWGADQNPGRGAGLWEGANQNNGRGSGGDSDSGQNWR